jgi:teichoic acid transport system ATP-binding protein
VAERIPTVIVDNVDVDYKIHGVHGDRGNTATSLARFLTRRVSPQVREVHAVRGVSFVAYRGEAIGVIGSNGSGKSTLLLTIARLLPPTRGTVYTKGQPSLLGVNAALMSDLTGERNIVLGCLAGGMTRAEVRARYDDIVKFSGINDNGDFVSLPMRTYSSGMGARLRFSIAAAKSHDVLLIDEALATGDAEFRRRSEARIRELRDEAGTVFLVSHSLGVVRETCERTIWLDRGRIVADGETDKVVAAYEARHDPESSAEAGPDHTVRDAVRVFDE